MVQKFRVDIHELVARNTVYSENYLANKAEWNSIFKTTMPRIFMIEQVKAALKSGYVRCGEKTILAALQFFAAR